MYAEVIIVDPFVVVAPFEREQEVVFLYELEALSRDLGFLLVRYTDIMLRKAVYGFIVDRISAAEEVFPLLVFKSICSISLGIKAGTEVGSGPAAKAQPESFHGVKSIERTGRGR